MIREYLNNPNKTYAQGLEIYNRYKITNQFDAFFNKVQNASPGSPHFNVLINKLNYMLNYVKDEPAQQQPEPPQPSVITVQKIDHTRSKPESIRVDANPSVRIELLPKELQELNEQIKADYKEMVRLQNIISRAPDEKPTLNENKKIVELKRSNRQMWAQIDKWWAENKDKLGEVNPFRDYELKTKRIAALKTNISRTSAKLKKAKESGAKTKPSQVSTWQTKIKNWKEEKTQLETDLKAATNAGQ